MSEKEVVEKLNKLAACEDWERTHAEADDLLCMFLFDLGYKKTVEAFAGVGKWYA